ncbi:MULTISPECIES: hypothetical protein [Acinetobacter]|uniref:Uncharacterized protein n=1 Tax=Acinetobacter junii TaxID=40215 RepID=A0A365PMG3_ACIJU|nr:MULTISPECIES: hypothetical protein [Acinetobacter]RBA42349.1 hypothetical protein DDF86_00355 [Acinetobacter junii]RBA42919.1 hypothetical protein DDG62_01600 [Acinetobacter junii]RBA49824.1 hypothetical protein DC346_01980 [Acinetobacter junii]WLF73457.1 hypothetical protein Q4617_05460 [Acinetobacter junii]
MTPTLSQIRAALQNLAAKKGRPDYELCTAKEVKMAFELGLDHPLIEELRGLIEFKPVVDEVVRTHRVSHARLVKHRVYPTAEQAKEIVDWIRSYGGRLVDVARIAGCAHSTLSLIRSGTRQSFTLDIYNKIMKARKELEGLAA